MCSRTSVINLISNDREGYMRAPRAAIPMVMVRVDGVPRLMPYITGHDMLDATGSMLTLVPKAPLAEAEGIDEEMFEEALWDLCLYHLKGDEEINYSLPIPTDDDGILTIHCTKYSYDVDGAGEDVVRVAPHSRLLLLLLDLQAPGVEPYCYNYNLVEMKNLKELADREREERKIVSQCDNTNTN